VYGMELEYTDLIRGKLPEGCTWSKLEYSLFNLSTHKLTIPNDKIALVGGEIQTRPTDTIAEQLELYDEINRFYPDANFMWRCAMHIHISKSDGGLPPLEEIKHAHLLIRDQRVMDRVCFLTAGGWKSEHHNLHKRYDPLFDFKHIAEKSLLAIQQARSIYEYKRAATKVVPSLNSRPYINLSSLFQRKTVEFRTFWMTKDRLQVRNALEFCDTLFNTLFSGTIEDVFELCANYKRSDFPAFPQFGEAEMILEGEMLKQKKTYLKSDKAISRMQAKYRRSLRQNRTILNHE
jgi:hypothetical protein